MYKTKLKELCHKRRWDLPRYCAMKDGPDHMPSFKASVFVNGVTFTSNAFSSSKEAHNQAAMHAFLTFSSASSTPTVDNDTKEQLGAAKPQFLPIPARSSVIIDDMDRLCKIQLQNYARKNNLDPPVFTCKIEGPLHAARFKATIRVNAAKVALMSLSLDLFEKGRYVECDNFTAEINSERRPFEPTYKTIQSGSPHLPTFFSTVKVEGMEFHGKGGRSKKQAEQDAAKIAYIALKECGVNLCAAFSPSRIENKAVKPNHSSDDTECKQNQ